jgi:dipeptidyl-peptidase-4
VLFLRSGPRSFVRDLYQLDVETGRERVVVTAEALLGGVEERLSPEEAARRERMRKVARGIADYRLSEDGRRLLVPLSGRLFVVERADGSFRELTSDAGYAIDPRFSPDGSRVACVRDGDLYVTEVATGVERRLTRGDAETRTHGLAEFVAQEEMRRYRGFWWSPDSKQLAYQATDTTGLETMRIPDPLRPQREPERWPYPRPGMANARVRLGLIPAQGGETTWVEWDHDRYEYLAAVAWPESGPLTLLVQNRRQTEERLLAVNRDDGSTRTLLVERDAAWLALHPGMPRWLPDGRGFLWITERDGAPQIELRSADGSLAHTLTSTDLGLQRFEHLLAERGELIVRASADPTQSHLYRVPLDPARGRPVRLTRGSGVHEVVSRSRAATFVVASSTLDGDATGLTVHAGVDAGKSRLRSLAETPNVEPRIELTTVGDRPGFHAVILRPHDFVAEGRYPVLVHVYGGPGSQRVRADPRRYLLDQWFANRGYVVVSVDGRGTPHRGRAWERAVKHDLIRVPLEDQVSALQALGAAHPEMDLSRVGIFGWSFGGYVSAMAVMRHPEVFHAAVAGAPVVDWRDYDTHYTERYMDLPANNPDGYLAASVLTYVDRLSRPLLVIHGTSDDNVYFLHSLKLIDALFRAGRPFEFLPLPGFTHRVTDPLVTERLYTRILDHFDRHLKPAASPGRAGP